MEDRTQNFISNLTGITRTEKKKLRVRERENFIKEKIEKLKTQVIIYIEGHTECAESCECNMR